MTDFAKTEAEAVLAKEAADRALREMAFKAMSLADHVHWLRDVGRGLPSREDMDGLYRFLDLYEAAHIESDAKRSASLQASEKWVAEAAIEQVGRGF